jgi:hypothetical protein
MTYKFAAQKSATRFPYIPENWLRGTGVQTGTSALRAGFESRPDAVEY